MADIANRSFIEGYCNVYNSTFTFYLNFTNSASGTLTQIIVNTDSNGYWRYKLSNGQQVKYMNSAFSKVSQSESNKLVSVKFSNQFCHSVKNWNNTFGNNTSDTYSCTNLTKVQGMMLYGNMDRYALHSTFRGCNYLKEVENISNWSTSGIESFTYLFYGCYSLESDSTNPFDMSGWDVSSLTTVNFIFGSVNSEANTWYSNKGWRIFSKLKDIRMFDVPNACLFQSNFIRLYGCQDNFDINYIGVINGVTISFTSTSLNLQSAKNVLSALHDLQGGSSTLSFSNSTLNLIRNDTTAYALAQQAQLYGWTITSL